MKQKKKSKILCTTEENILQLKIQNKIHVYWAQHIAGKINKAQCISRHFPEKLVNKEKNLPSICAEKKWLIYKKPRTMLALDPILRSLISEYNKVIYREFEKGNDVIFGDCSQYLS